MSRRHQPPPQPAGPPTLARTQLPVDQLHTLQNRLAQLIRSIAEFEKALVSSQGLEEWPALLSRFSSLLSHTFSLSSSLISPSAHFIPSQLAALEEGLRSQAEADNVYADGPASPGRALGGSPGGEEADARVTDATGVREVRYSDDRNALPRLAVHPLLSIVELEKQGILGMLLRTKAMPEIEAAEAALLASSDAPGAIGDAPRDPAVAFLSKALDTGSGGDAETEQDPEKVHAEVQEEIAAHDALVARALRMWYHLEAAPDEEGASYDWKMRLGRDEEETPGEHTGNEAPALPTALT